MPFKMLLRKNIYLLLAVAWLVTISFIIDNYWAANSSAGAVQRKISSYIHTEENDFDTLFAGKNNIENLSAKQYDAKLLQQMTDKKYFFFIYDKDELGLFRLLFWNTQVVQPDVQILQQEGKSGFTQLGNGYYVWRKQQNNNLTVLALIPVKWNYSITNEYLVNSFAADEGLENSFALSELENEAAVKSKDGVFLFSLVQKTATGVQGNNIVAAMLRIAAVILLLLFIQIVAGNFVQQNFYKGVFFLVSALALFRLAGYYLPVPVNLRQYELFDPKVYAANVVLRSLGDLLINAVGRSDRGLLEQLGAMDLASLLNDNLMCTWNMICIMLESLKRARGTIVNIGSLAGLVPAPGMGGYSISKSALTAMSRQLRLELASHGVHVMLVCPGPIARDDSRTRYEKLAEERGLNSQSATAPGGGVKLRLIDPNNLCQRILNAAHFRKKELVCPRKAAWLAAIANVFPSLADWILSKYIKIRREAK